MNSRRLSSRSRFSSGPAPRHTALSRRSENSRPVTEALQKAYDAAKDVDPERLERALGAIRDYEWEVKSGQIDAELGLEVLLARL